MIGFNLWGRFNIFTTELGLFAKSSLAYKDS